MSTSDRETRGLILTLIGALVAAVFLIIGSAHLAGIDLEVVIVVLFLASAVVVNPYFVILSTRRWWETPVGRALWVKALGNAIIINLSLLGLLTHRSYPFREEALTAGMTVFLAGMTYLTVTAVNTPRVPRRSEDARRFLSRDDAE